MSSGTLFFDTETSNMWDFKATDDAPHQPYPMQIAGILDDAKGITRGVFSAILKWDRDFVVSPKALAVHGLTTEIVEHYGMPALNVLAIFNNYISFADTLVAHNINFDIRIIKRAYAAVEKEFPSEVSQLCTMQKATPIIRIPHPRNNGYKWPSLDEAYRHFVDVGGFEGAHDALVDVRACREVYYKMKEQGYV